MWVSPALSSGLGNRLFQLAAAAGAAERWGYSLVFYLPACKDSPHGPIASIFKMFPGIRLMEEAVSVTELTEPPRHFYNYIPIMLPAVHTGHILVKGFRQSPLYFPKELRPDWDSALGGALIRRKVDALAGLTDIAERQRTYALHLRLGDYRLLPHHQVELAHYYDKALARLPAGARLHLFSDEPNACAKLFNSICSARQLQMSMAVTASDVESLYEMSLCLGGTITANSTFSWWGAWFAHQNGAAWATYPDSMGNGQPEPTDFVPEWGIVLPTKH
jgi:hypothetical protein